MTLFLLRPRGDWKPWYDKADGFVIRAINETIAREFAANNCGDEGPKVWLDPKQTTCEILLPDGGAGVILRDFAGA